MPPCLRPSRVKLLRAGSSAALDGRCARWMRKCWSGRRNGAAPDRTAEWQTGCTGHARSIFPCPHGKYATDDSRRGCHSEVTPVERVHGLPVHEEELPVFDDVAPFSVRQRPATTIVHPRLAHRDAVDRNDAPVSANSLSGKRQHALQHRNSSRQVAISVQVGRQRLGRLNGDEFSDVVIAGRAQAIEAKRDTLRTVPDVDWGRLCDDRPGENGNCADRHGECSVSGRQGATFRR
jgi:hypothetical protein